VTLGCSGGERPGADPDLEHAGGIVPQHAVGLVDLHFLAVVASRSLDQAGEQGTKSSRGRVVDRDAVVPERCTLSRGGLAFGIVARTSSWMNLSTERRNARVPPATAKKAG
jgi:hypothetical protein